MATAVQEAVDLIYQKRNAEAGQVLRSYLQENPNDDDAWFWSAYCEPTYDGFRSCLERAVTLNPKNRRAIIELGKAYAQEEQPDQTQVATTQEAAPEVSVAHICPFCKMEVPQGARVCPYCRNEISGAALAETFIKKLGGFIFSAIVFVVVSVLVYIWLTS